MVKDPRLRFINLAQHGPYPIEPVHHWMAAGYAPANVALAIAQGKWITPCDDDDEITDDHVEIPTRRGPQATPRICVEQG